jgi:hypothetical protein
MGCTRNTDFRPPAAQVAFHDRQMWKQPTGQRLQWGRRNISSRVSKY